MWLPLLWYLLIEIDRSYNTTTDEITLFLCAEGSSLKIEHNNAEHSRDNAFYSRRIHQKCNGSSWNRWFPLREHSLNKDQITLTSCMCHISISVTRLTGVSTNNETTQIYYCKFLNYIHQVWVTNLDDVRQRFYLF